MTPLYAADRLATEVVGYGLVEAAAPVAAWQGELLVTVCETPSW